MLYEVITHARWDPEIEAEGPVRQVWELEVKVILTKKLICQADALPTIRPRE